MNYKFETQKLDIDNYPYYFISISNEYKIITRFSDSGWTPQKVQEIIDKVESNRSLEKTKDPYLWGNEDLTVFANELGVLLVDKLAMRAKQEVEPLELTHDEFIIFMKDFKKFIEENS